MIGECGLTLPPQTEPLNESRRNDQLQRRQSELGKARMDRVRAEGLRMLRRVITLGIWWK